MPIANQAPQHAPVPAGVQHAVCYQVIDIGTQPQQGNFPSRRKVMIVWELPNERTEFTKDGHSIEMPRAISRDYTLSTDKKANLRKDLEAWRGRAFNEDEAKSFEVGNLIGANCQLNVIHKKSTDGTRTYANVGGIMPLAKDTVKLTPENPTLVFDLPKQGPVEFPLTMPEWIQNKIKNSDEYHDLINPRASEPSEAQNANLSTVDDGDVPF